MSHQAEPQPSLITDQTFQINSSPVLIIHKQQGFKISLQPFEEEKKKNDDLNEISDPIEYVKKSIEIIRSITRKRKPQDDLHNLSPCHSCHENLQPRYMRCCTDPECQRHFCLVCLSKRYGVTHRIIYDMLHLKEWKCYYCQKTCTCKMCRERQQDKGQVFTQLSTFEKSRKKLSQSSDLSYQLSGNSNFTNTRSDSIQGIPKSFGDPLQQPPAPTKGKRGGYRGRKAHKLQENGQSAGSGQQTQKLLNNDLDAYQTDTLSPPLTKSPKVKRCHLCSKRTYRTNMARCSVDQCSKGYCFECIKKKFQSDFNFEHHYNPELWVCYSCGGHCKCEKCSTRLRSPAFRRPGRGGGRPKKNATGPSKPGRGRPSIYSKKYIDNLPDGLTVKDNIYTQAPGSELTNALKSAGDSVNGQLKNGKLDSAKKVKTEIQKPMEKIDEKKILDEINIDSICFTLYDVEHEEQLFDPK